MDRQILYLDEVAELLRISKTKAYQLSRSGEIPSFKVGQRWLFNRNELEKWMREGGTRHEVAAD